jgi:hypothetical protein
MNLKCRANNSASLSVLNRLFSLHSSALPGYVVQANPYVASGDEHLLALVRSIAAQKEKGALRIADAILALNGRLPRPTYPMHYTELNNLELRFLLARIRDEQRSDVRKVEAAARSLTGDPDLQKLASKIRRDEVALLNLLEDIVARYPAAQPAGQDATLPRRSRDHTSWTLAAQCAA